VRKVTATAIAEWPRSRPLRYSFVVASGHGTRTFEAIINPARGVEILGFNGVALLIEQVSGKPRSTVAKGPVA